MRALRDAPYAFMSSLEREAAHDPEFWEQWVGESDLGVAGAIFVAIDDGAGVAMAGGFFADDARETATLWGMWVDPAARRRGLGRCQFAIGGNRVPSVTARSRAVSRPRLCAHRGAGTARIRPHAHYAGYDAPDLAPSVLPT